MNGKREATENRFRRIKGMSPEKREKLAERLSQMNDWWAKCPVCGKKLQGTPAEIQAHSHDDL